MGCSPIGTMISRFLKRFSTGDGKAKKPPKGKGKKKKKSHKRNKKQQPQENLARSVSQGNPTPIYVSHPTAETATTWEPPQIPPATTSAPHPAHGFPAHPAHGFPDTAETKQVVQVHYAEPNTSGANGYNSPKYPSYSRHESDFRRYSYNDTYITDRECYEEGGSNNNNSNNNRVEYLCGEYQYYSTPVRENIYSLATDGNRITSIFSDENPNACTII